MAVAAAAQTTSSASSLFKDAKPSIVLILGSDSNGQTTVQGSGFIVAKDEIVTNHHVLVGIPSATAIFSDGATAELRDVVADSASSDLIVVTVNTDQRPALRIGDEMSLQQGDVVYAIGAPKGLELTLTNGIVSAFRNLDGRFLIQSTAAIGHGSSGGPLFDHDGRVVGITSSTLSDTPGIYFSVGAGDLKRLLRTPEAVLVPLADWAKDNPDTTVSTGNSAAVPDSTDVNIQKLLQNGKYDEAKAQIQSLSDKNPDAEVVHRLTGQLDLDLGDEDSALRELSVAIGKDPRDAIGQFYYAVALMDNRQYADALSHEEVSNQLAPSDSDKPLLALLYYATRDYSRAQTAANNALTSDPTNEAALGVLAGLSYHRISGQANDWKTYARKIAPLDAANFWVQMSIAIDAYNQNQAAKAIQAFQAAEKAGFPDSAPYLFLATWYERGSDIGDANDQIVLGLAAVPGNSDLLSQGTFISLRANDFAEAGRRFSSLQQLYPDTAQTLGTGCLYYYGTGQSENALQQCSRDLALDPNDHGAHSNYGWAALDANQFPLALEQFSDAYKIVEPKLDQLTKVQVVDLLWGFTIAQYEMGNKKEAHKLLQAVRQSYPDCASVTGLQQMPLLWSITTMTRIEGILREFPK